MNELQPCCHPGFRMQALSLTVTCTVILPECRLNDLCRTYVFIAVTAGNGVCC